MSLKERITDFLAKNEQNFCGISIILISIAVPTLGAWLGTTKSIYGVIGLFSFDLSIIMFILSCKGEEINNQRFMDELFGPKKRKSRYRKK